MHETRIPSIRRGVPPIADYIQRQPEYVILVVKRGWIIARWHTGHGIMVDSDKSIPFDYRAIVPSEIVAWMPADGS